MTRWLALAAAVMLTFMACPPGWAGSPTDDLRTFFAAAGRILDDPEAGEQPTTRLGAIRAVTAEIFDVRDAAQLSLGPDWSARTPAEQAEFVRLFADLLERSFIFGVATRIRLSDGVRVSYVDEVRDGDAAMVRTTLASRNGGALSLDYRMIERGDRWLIRDVVIDGVSLASNYRSQFTRVLQNSSYPALVEMLRARMSAMPLDATASAAPLPPASDDASAVDVQVSALPPPDAPSGADIRSSETTPLEGAPSAVPDRVPTERVARPEREPSRQPDAKTPARAESGPKSMVSSYWVQLGAFKNHEAARRLVSLLKQHGGASSGPVVTVQSGPAGTPFARVRIGPFSNRAAATSTLHEFETRGYTPFIAEESR
jgi:phospholipid transport system substrate-binding protein